MHIAKKPFSLPAIMVLISLFLFLAMDTPSTYGDDGDDNDYQFTIPEKANLKYPNLGSSLDQMVTRVVEEEGAESERATGEDPVHQSESVAVTIYLSGNVDEMVSFLEDSGVLPRNVGEDYIEAYVPVTLLGPISEQPGVLRVREIIPPQPAFGNVVSQGVQAHISGAWNRAGYSGQGVKIGIIDIGFESFSNLMGSELPATVAVRCYRAFGEVTSATQDLANCEKGNNHGTLVAETVMDIAPEASLYIANPISLGDLSDAVDWMASEGVSIINYSVSQLFDGPGDGTSPFSNSPLKVVDRAVDAGIIWVSASGNYAQRTWFGTPADPDNDGVINFRGADEGNTTLFEEGDRVVIQLRWDDTWGGANRDLDLCIGDPATGQLLFCTEDYQIGRVGDLPTEILVFDMLRTRELSIVVFHQSGAVPSWIQVLARGYAGTFEHHTSYGSIVSPAESNNPGLLAVGATHWKDVFTIEPYSGRGPTPDGRIKPDVVGAACGETSLTPSNELGNGFCGTSQATPHVAGMAALVRQRFPDYSPVQVANYLKDRTGQWESPHPNNTWGHGFAYLHLPLPPVAPAVTIPITAGADSMAVEWSPHGDGTREPITAYDLRYIRTAIADTAESNWTVLEDVGTSGPGSQRHILTGLTGGTPYSVQVRGVNIWGEGDWSATATGVTAPPVVPGMPRGLTAAVAVDEARVDLLWTAPVRNGGAMITSYKVESSVDGNSPWVEVYTTTGPTTSYTDDGTDGNGPTFGVGVTRYYRVSAVNSVGTGSPSTAAIATLDKCRDPLGLLTAPVTRMGVWADDCGSEARIGSFAHYYSFTLGQPKRVAIYLTSALDTYLVLRDGERKTGNPLHQNDDVLVGRNPNSRIEENLPAGNHTVEATTYGRGIHGNFTVDVREITCVRDLPQLTETFNTPGTLSSECGSTQREGGYARSYRFTLGEPTGLRIDLTSALDTYLYVLNADGTVYDENDDVVPGRNPNSRVAGNTPAGTYIVEATTYGPMIEGEFILNIGVTAP